MTSAWCEYNFDGLVGPTHNFLGLSFGNLASAANARQPSAPRAAALQGLDKMRTVMGLGIGQGFLLPHMRPNADWLAGFGFSGTPAEICASAWKEEPDLLLAATSASAMWAANAATVSPAPDTDDQRTHFTPANLSTMVHRSHEWPEAQRQLRMIFADTRFFHVHEPVPARFGDEGAANFMRIAFSHGEPGTEIMVHGVLREGGFPARQSDVAGRTIFRQHGVAKALHVAQSEQAIAAGAFHNDVVAVANERLLFAHELAFADKDVFFEQLRALEPRVMIVEVAESDVPLADAISSYLFNSQLVTLPDGAMALILPMECRESPSVKRWLDINVGGNKPISQAHFVEVRESMRNGGGPACLRLRVLLNEDAAKALDHRFILTAKIADQLQSVIESWWPERLAAGDMGHRDFWQESWNALEALRACVERRL